MSLTVNRTEEKEVNWADLIDGLRYGGFRRSVGGRGPEAAPPPRRGDDGGGPTARRGEPGAGIRVARSDGSVGTAAVRTPEGHECEGESACGAHTGARYCQAGASDKRRC